MQHLPAGGLLLLLALLSLDLLIQLLLKRLAVGTGVIRSSLETMVYFLFIGP